MQLLAPVVVSILEQASDGCPPSAPGTDIRITPALLFKEASYNAVGAAYYDLHDYIDFKSWFVSLPVVFHLSCGLTSSIVHISRSKYQTITVCG